MLDLFSRLLPQQNAQHTSQVETKGKHEGRFAQPWRNEPMGILKERANRNHNASVESKHRQAHYRTFISRGVHMAVQGREDSQKQNLRVQNSTRKRTQKRPRILPVHRVFNQLKLVGVLSRHRRHHVQTAGGTRTRPFPHHGGEKMRPRPT